MLHVPIPPFFSSCAALINTKDMVHVLVASEFTHSIHLHI